MKIVLLETLHPDAEVMLAAQDALHLAASLDEASVVELASDADALLTRGRGRITRRVLQAGGQLRAVARCGVGLDNIDLVAASEQGVPVIYAPGSTTGTLAEHTLLLLLASARQLCALDAAARAGRWEVRDGYQGRELAGKTLGIVGLGDIGRRVAGLAATFGMQVAYWSPNSRDERYHYLPFERLLAQADMISLHARLTDETRQMIGPQQLALLRRGAALINTARGALVDEAALAEALRSGQLAAYATDVLSQEPPPADHPLLGAPNVIITPHSAALTDQSYRAMCVDTAANVLRVLRGEVPELRCVANLKAVRERYGW